jgi:hypothetical protein
LEIDLSVDFFLIIFILIEKDFVMLPFDYKKALSGRHLCKLKNGMYAILYADISNDPRIPNEHESPLLGIVFNLDKVSYPQHWTLSGRFKVNSD